MSWIKPMYFSRNIKKLLKVYFLVYGSNIVQILHPTQTPSTQYQNIVGS